MRASLCLPLALALLLGVGWSRPAPAQNVLTVLDPQQPWHRYPGTIEEAVLTVRPKGIYMEHALYLTFSARGSSFTPADTLEVELFFTLPEEAAITDSWLWFNDQILEAEIIDAWTASSIYENIVRRRRDPSILFKRGPGQYEFRIFPMAGGETRKVKITYLVPALWAAGTVSTSLPSHLLQTSGHPIPSIRLLTWPNETGRAPRLIEQPGIFFEEQVDPDLGTHMAAELPWEAVQGSLTLAFDTPLQDGIYLSQVPREGELFYQLALLPAAAMDVASRSVALLLDYDASRTSIGSADLLATARSLLHTSLSPVDSFNLMVSRLDIRRASETWLPADSASIEAAFEALGEDPLGGYSNLPALLSEGVGFIEANGRHGSLLLLSSNDQFGEVETANELIRDLQEAAPQLPPIYVLDLANRNVSSYWIGERYYEGNDYFYTNLAKLSGGHYLNLRDGTSFSHALATMLGTLGGVIGSFDLYTTLENGFCYARFTSNAGNQAIYGGQAVLQVGKCFGTPPFRVEASGLHQSRPFSQRFVVEEADVLESDTTLVSMWTGRQIRALEQDVQTNAVVSQIIDYSVERRVLSLYTAFLALEPGMAEQVCATCSGDEGDTGGQPTDVEDEAPVEPEGIVAYPNPFSRRVTIAVNLAAPVEAGQVTVQIYNVMGQLVTTLDVEGAGKSRRFELVWDGSNEAGQELASGTYFVVVTTPTRRHALALVLVR